MDLAVAPDLWMAAPQAEALYRIAQARLYFDSMTLLQQLGVVPHPSS